MMGAYYSVTTWLPTYLKNERHLSVVGTSSYLLVLIAGSFAGYLAGAWLSDALGRRRCFMLFAVCGALLILAYTWMPISDTEMLALGFPLGFFLSGAVSAFCPVLIGAGSAHASLGVGIGAMTAAGYGLVVAAAWVLPETRGRSLRRAAP